MWSVPIVIRGFLHLQGTFLGRTAPTNVNKVKRRGSSDHGGGNSRSYIFGNREDSNSALPVTADEQARSRHRLDDYHCGAFHKRWPDVF